MQIHFRVSGPTRVHKTLDGNHQRRSFGGKFEWRSSVPCGSAKTRTQNLFLYRNKVPASARRSAVHGVGSANLGVEVNFVLGDPPRGSQASGITARPRFWAVPEIYKYRWTHPPLFHSNHHPLFTHSPPLTTSGLYLDAFDVRGALARRWHR
ncbi:hypothetical protein C8R43DRAFT_985777 [Mycena crocata]|nr:hypothetical protein C8R43DRAFT_985777 [Mycena crocata]